ncbi:hypothetical protein RRG08_022364 [Elysia crispata]|uniref:Uncharacterized protein n=1 Tax=Elysia crispata TaxID=231223 RepID=A0AAE0Z2A6_9GAST|nr:hypothetical protein RRG08_022364 [Elysia crispata]
MHRMKTQHAPGELVKSFKLVQISIKDLVVVLTLTTKPDRIHCACVKEFQLSQRIGGAYGAGAHNSCWEFSRDDELFSGGETYNLSLSLKSADNPLSPA